MKPMMESRYVGWMAVRPLKFGDETFEPGDRIPQKHLDVMRDPEVLVRTGRIAAVAKDMNKVPRMLRKDVMLEGEQRDKILTPRAAGQNGPIVPTHLLGTEHDPTSKAHKSMQRALKAAEKEAAEQAEAAQLDAAEEPTEEVLGFPEFPTPSITTVDARPVENPVDEPEEDDVVSEVAPGTPLTADEDGNLRTPDGQVYDGPVEEVGETTENPVPEPARNASTQEWAEFALGSGATEEDIDGMNRTELIEKYATPETPEES